MGQKAVVTWRKVFGAALFASIGAISIVEVVFPLWLLIKGVDAAKWESRLSSAT